MNSQVVLCKPSPKYALNPLQGALLTAAIIGPFLGAEYLDLSESSQSRLLAFSGVVIAVSILNSLVAAVRRPRFVRPPEGRRLEVSAGVLRQYENDELCAEIDATREFSYKIVDRYEPKKALIRLFQERDSLAFYVSDPGGIEVVRSIVKIPWPPRNRSAGRSYPPSAA